MEFINKLLGYYAYLPLPILAPLTMSFLAIASYKLHRNYRSSTTLLLVIFCSLLLVFYVASFLLGRATLQLSGSDSTANVIIFFSQLTDIITIYIALLAAITLSVFLLRISK